MRGRAWGVGAIAAFVLALAAPASAIKTDVVVMSNGDRITCEIKLLQRGKLQVSTDGIGTVDVEWLRVKSVAAARLFEVEDLVGRLYLGSLAPSADGVRLDVVGLAGTSTVDLVLVARIQPLRRSFWRQLSGSFDAGFSYTSSSKLTQFSLDGSVRYRRPKFQLQLDANTLVTKQPDAPETQRGSAGLGYVRFLRNRKLTFGKVLLEQNRELGYELRASLIGGWGSYLMRSQGNEVLAAIGLNLNHEEPVEGEATENVEGLIGFDWENYAFVSPKTDISVQVNVYPSLSEWGRVRVEANARLKRELFSDFYVSLTAYDSYDSDPATEGASKSDYGFSLGLSYSFN